MAVKIRQIARMAAIVAITACILAAVALALFFDSAIAAAATWGLAAFAVIAVFAVSWMVLAPGSKELTEIAQAIAGVVTVAAIFIAAGFYFLERKDKPGISFDIVATRALLSNPSTGNLGTRSSENRVLLGIRLLVTNRSSRQIEMKCIALGLSRPAPSGLLARSETATEEMQLEPVVEPEPILYGRLSGRGGERDRMALQIRECLAADLFRVRQEDPDALAATVRPLFMWGPLRLEPNDFDDRHFEIEIGCDVPFVRVLAKMRINPTDRDVYETKAIIPLREVCEGRAQGIAMSVTADGLLNTETNAATAPIATNESAD